MNNENTENSVEGDHHSLINILLQNPEDFNLKQKPSGIRENKMFTLDMREISISSAKGDDNGAYISKGSVTKFYMYNDGSGVWYVNIRDSKGYRKEIVPANEIYELKREYHTSKSNPKFSRAITTIKGYAENEPRPVYVVTYKWANGADKRFDLPWHRNATKPTSGQYYSKDPSLFSKVDNLMAKGLPTDQVYNSIARAGASTISEATPGLKSIDNTKLLSKKVPSARNNSKVKQRR